MTYRPHRTKAGIVVSRYFPSTVRVFSDFLLLFLASLGEHGPSAIKTNTDVFCEEQQLHCPWYSSLSLRRTSRRGLRYALWRLLR